MNAKRREQSVLVQDKNKYIILQLIKKSVKKLGNTYVVISPKGRLIKRSVILVVERSKRCGSTRSRFELGSQAHLRSLLYCAYAREPWKAVHLFFLIKIPRPRNSTHKNNNSLKKFS